MEVTDHYSEMMWITNSDYSVELCFYDTYFMAETHKGKRRWVALALRGIDWHSWHGGARRLMVTAWRPGDVRRAVLSSNFWRRPHAGRCAENSSAKQRKWKRRMSTSDTSVIAQPVGAAPSFAFSMSLRRRRVRRHCAQTPFFALLWTSYAAVQIGRITGFARPFVRPPWAAQL